jgi:hypothetical protein
MISKGELLAVLPEYKDQWILINPNQTVIDIIHEVLEAHEEFAPMYDLIAPYFECETIEKTASTLYKFCKKNLIYDEESESFQSTSVPQGLLTRGECDCKGYSNFIGGVLDALNRNGNNIDWNYRFASYELLNKSPHHVFIVARSEDGKEIWIDPTPGASDLQPVWRVDKKISAMTTSRKTIGAAAIGIDSLAVTPMLNNRKQLDHDGTGKYDGKLMTQGNDPFIGLSQYRDWGGNRNINENSVADQINSVIAQHGKTHTFTGPFIKWIYDNNLRHWNFYYPWGVPIGWSAKDILPENYPKLIVTPDGRLNFDRWAPLDDYHNAEIHLLNAWAQSMINQFLKTPFPLKPADLKGFSQGNDGGEDSRNLFLEHRGDSIFSQIGHWINDAFNWVKDGVLTVIGSIPRKAFLTLIDLNVFHWADHLQAEIDAGNWDEISTKWENLGGDRNRLWEIIKKGITKPAIDDDMQQIDATLGEPMTVAAVITAASPIVVAMLRFLNKDGKLDPYLNALQAGLKTAFPDEDWRFLNGALYANGQPVQFGVNDYNNENSPYYNPPDQQTGIMAWIKNNPLPAAGVAAIGTAMLTKRPGQRLNYTLGAVAGVIVYVLAKSNVGQSGGNYLSTNNSAATLTTDQKRTALVNWANSSTTDSAESTAYIIDIFQSMSPSEINTVYTFVFEYAMKNRPVPEGTKLYNDMMQITEYYEIFT